jgi:hypothetical protein
MNPMFRAVAGLALALSLTSSTDAAACSCPQPDLIYNYNYADSAYIGWAISQSVAGNWRTYTVRVLRDLKGCTAPGTIISIQTPRYGAACGTSIPLRTPWLIFGDSGITSACMGNRNPATLTTDEREYLENRPITCGGVTTCADGSGQWICSDPCATVACRGGACVPNYCGGCTAEFYDPSGYGACLPW